MISYKLIYIDFLHDFEDFMWQLEDFYWIVLQQELYGILL